MCAMTHPTSSGPLGRGVVLAPVLVNSVAVGSPAHFVRLGLHLSTRTPGGPATVLRSRVLGLCLVAGHEPDGRAQLPPHLMWRRCSIGPPAR